MALLTVRAAAGRLGVGYSTLKQWILAGRVRTSRTAGGHHRVSDAEIARLLARTTPLRRTANRPDERRSIVALSDPNRLRGFVDEVRTEGLLGMVCLRIGDHRITAVITKDAIDELKLLRGNDAVAIIKCTDVIIAREAITDLRPPRRTRRARR